MNWKIEKLILLKLLKYKPNAKNNCFVIRSMWNNNFQRLGFVQKQGILFPLKVSNDQMEIVSITNH